jgi:hypothetical protein
MALGHVAAALRDARAAGARPDAVDPFTAHYLGYKDDRDVVGLSAAAEVSRLYEARATAVDAALTLTAKRAWIKARKSDPAATLVRPSMPATDPAVLHLAELLHELETN